MFLQNIFKKCSCSDVLQNRCSYEFTNIHKKITVTDDKYRTDGLQSYLKKETPTQVFSCEYHKMFENSFLYGMLPVAASENG